MIKLGCKDLRDNIMSDLISKSKDCQLTRKPCLAVILVGDNPASQTYVKKKLEACQNLGFECQDIVFTKDTTEFEILDCIRNLNRDSNVTGILVQLPLPSHINEFNIIKAISPLKDVDGFSPYNTGLMSIGKDAYVPCTPAGILEIFKYFNIEVTGKHVVIIGRSNIVGRPMAELLSQKGVDATVTLCHSKTPDIERFTKIADIIIVATGRPGTLTSGMTKNNAIIIDVGVNRIEDASKKKGFRLVGDVDIDSFSNTQCSITPVPGGVGLMTVAMLMKNTLQSAIKAAEEAK